MKKTFINNLFQNLIETDNINMCKKVVLSCFQSFYYIRSVMWKVYLKVIAKVSKFILKVFVRETYYFVYTVYKILIIEIESFTFSFLLRLQYCFLQELWVVYISQLILFAIFVFFLFKYWELFLYWIFECWKTTSLRHGIVWWVNDAHFLCLDFEAKHMWHGFTVIATF